MFKTKLKQPFVLILIQLFFVLLVAINSPAHVWLALLILVLWFKKMPVEENVNKWYSLILFAIAGFYATLLCRIFLNEVLAVAFVTLLLSFFKKVENYQLGVFYAAGFAAMSGWMAWDNIALIIVPILVAFCAYALKNHLHGVGGKLGSIGFFGAVLAYWIWDIW